MGNAVCLLVADKPWSTALSEFSRRISVSQLLGKTFYRQDEKV